MDLQKARLLQPNPSPRPKGIYMYVHTQAHTQCILLWYALLDP